MTCTSDFATERHKSPARTISAYALRIFALAAAARHAIIIVAPTGFAAAFASTTTLTPQQQYHASIKNATHDVAPRATTARA
jgi:hypothetical protein